MMQNRVYGVDFSGATDAGRKIWIAGGVIDRSNAMRLEMCTRAAELPGSGRQRERALEALREFILAQPPCAVGMDFPFGLPRALVAKDRWEDFVNSFAECYPDANTFKATCWQAADGKELRRVTDIDAGTPFSPYNLRLYRQTYFGISHVLAPLVRTGKVSVLPMQPAAPDRTWLMEICPASTLKDMRLYQTYKKAASAVVRDLILPNSSKALESWFRKASERMS